MVIVNKRNASDVGGVEVVLRQMLEAVTCSDIVVLTYNEDSKTTHERLNDIECIRLGSDFQYGPVRWSLKFRQTLNNLAKEHDTVFYHYPSFQTEMCTVKFRNKLVYYHADVTKYGFLGVLYQRFVASRFLKDADEILVSSPNIIRTSGTLRKFSDKCRVVALGIDVNHFIYKPDNRRHLILKDGEDKLLMFVGRMSRYKGFGNILKALAALDRTYRLLVVSQDRYKPRDYRYILKKGLDSRITKISDADYDELPYYYSSADVLLMPSTDRAEAFGLVAVEAMACSVPVISTELGTGTSYHNIDGVTGRVIKPGSVGELHDSIEEVVRLTLDKAVIRKRAEEFSLGKFNERMNSIIRLYEKGLPEKVVREN